MSKWITIKELSKIYRSSQTWVRMIIYKEEFNKYCAYQRPIMINYCKEFKILFESYIKIKNIRKTKEEYFNNYTKNINPDILLKWTPTSIDCYEIGCNCNKCELYRILNTKCQMKNVVMELVKKFGAPNINNNSILED